MKIRLVSLGFVLGLSVALVAAVWARTSPQEQPRQMPSEQEMELMMQEYLKSLQPGEAHKRMNVLAGKWDSTIRIWMQGPTNPPTEITGITTRQWVLGERFLQERLEAQFPMPDMKTGEMTMIPWEGTGLFGFDNNRRMYVGCWADTMGTQLLTMTGSASPDGKTFTYFGEMDEPQLGVYGRTVKYRTQVVTDDHVVFAIFDLHAGDNYKVVEVTHRRKRE